MGTVAPSAAVLFVLRHFRRCAARNAPESAQYFKRRAEMAGTTREAAGNGGNPGWVGSQTGVPRHSPVDPDSTGRGVSDIGSIVRAIPTTRLPIRCHRLSECLARESVSSPVISPVIGLSGVTAVALSLKPNEILITSVAPKG